MSYFRYCIAFKNTLVVTESLVCAEFSEALEELGGCFLAKTALNGDDDDSGKNIQVLV